MTFDDDERAVLDVVVEHLRAAALMTKGLGRIPRYDEDGLRRLGKLELERLAAQQHLTSSAVVARLSMHAEKLAERLRRGEFTMPTPAEWDARTTTERPT